ncbi:MAG: FliM/FliN family flagellar motor switch protein [[Eubacterium] siraeum]
MNLQVNDIIPLNKPITDNVQLKVGSTCWFDGKLGTLNGKKAFRIDNILKN